MVTQTIDINLVPGISAPVCHVSQYDVGREITFNLYSGTEAYTPTTGAVIVCNGTKSNGTGFASSTTWSGNVVTVTTDAQMTDMAGISYCELVITVGSVRVGTANFLMAVERAGVNEDTEFDEAQIAYVAYALARLGSTESAFDFLNNRIDNLIAPSADPTLSEVVDIRLAYDGTSYATAGEAVRGQVGSIETDISTLQNSVWTNAQIDSLCNILLMCVTSGDQSTAIEDLRESLKSRGGMSITYTDGVLTISGFDSTPTITAV